MRIVLTEEEKVEFQKCGGTVEAWMKYLTDVSSHKRKDRLFKYWDKAYGTTDVDKLYEMHQRTKQELEARNKELDGANTCKQLPELRKSKNVDQASLEAAVENYKAFEGYTSWSLSCQNETTAPPEPIWSSEEIDAYIKKAMSGKNRRSMAAFVMRQAFCDLFASFVKFYRDVKLALWTLYG